MENITFVCKFCGSVRKGLNSLHCHERLCKENPDKKVSNLRAFIEKGHKGSNQYTKASKLGLPKPEMSVETKKRISESKLGQKNSAKRPEIRKKISESVKRWCAEHPSEVPYRKYHSSKESYPEKYFREVLENSKIDFNQEYSVNRYSLDFAFPEKKLYFEVDGKQHENMKEHDAIRTKFLEENGWKLLCRIEWWKFKKLSQDDQKVFCENLIKQING